MYLSFSSVCISYWHTLYFLISVKAKNITSKIALYKFYSSDVLRFSTVVVFIFDVILK